MPVRTVGASHLGFAAPPGAVPPVFSSTPSLDSDCFGDTIGENGNLPLLLGPLSSLMRRLLNRPEDLLAGSLLELVYVVQIGLV
jgi:hypothetical protein